MEDEVFAFRGIGRFVALGVAGGLIQAGVGLNSLRLAAARRRLRTAGLGAAWLCSTGVLLSAVALTCRDSSVRLTERGIEVRLGRLWRQRIPYHAIAAAVPVERAITEGFGVRSDFRGTIAVVPWGLRAVELDLAPAQSLPVLLFVRHDARRLLLGVEDRERFITALMNRVLYIRPSPR